MLKRFIIMVFIFLLFFTACERECVGTPEKCFSQAMLDACTELGDEKTPMGNVGAICCEGLVYKYMNCDAKWE